MASWLSFHLSNHSSLFSPLIVSKCSLRFPSLVFFIPYSPLGNYGIVSASLASLSRSSYDGYFHPDITQKHKCASQTTEHSLFKPNLLKTQPWRVLPYPPPTHTPHLPLSQDLFYSRLHHPHHLPVQCLRKDSGSLISPHRPYLSTPSTRLTEFVALPKHDTSSPVLQLSPFRVHGHQFCLFSFKFLCVLP